MGLFSKAAPEGEIATSVPDIADEKGGAQKDPAQISEEPDLSNGEDEHVQGGVQKIEAAAQVWSTRSMVGAYIM
jgi:chitodextrinase